MNRPGTVTPHVAVNERLPTFDVATLVSLDGLRRALGEREAARLEYQRAVTLSAKGIATAKCDRASVKIRTLREGLIESLRQEALEGA